MVTIFNGTNNQVFYFLDTQAQNLTLRGDTSGLTFATITVEAFADSDEEWPRADENENFLGSASIVFDPRDPATLGALSLGPTDTDDDDTGYLVEAFVRVAPPTAAADVRLKLDDVVVYEEEDWGATHMALYVYAKGPGIDREIFRWNNGDGEVEAPDGYGLGNGYDFIGYFEFADAHAPIFRAVMSGLRDREQTLASYRRIEEIMARYNAQLWANHDKSQHAGLRKSPEYYE